MLDADEKLVPVATFDSPHLAEIAKLRLESEGIPVVIPGRAPSPFTAGHAAPWGGLQLKVRESDEVRAAQILREAATADSPADLSPTCPRCGSERVRLKRPPIFGAIARLVTRLLLAALARDHGSESSRKGEEMPYRCGDCKHTWTSTGAAKEA